MPETMSKEDQSAELTRLTAEVATAKEVLDIHTKARNEKMQSYRTRVQPNFDRIQELQMKKVNLDLYKEKARVGVDHEWVTKRHAKLDEDIAGHQKVISDTEKEWQQAGQPEIEAVQKAMAALNEAQKCYEGFLVLTQE